jgi:hypothetical protein
LDYVGAICVESFLHQVTNELTAAAREEGHDLGAGRIAEARDIPSTRALETPPSRRIVLHADSISVPLEGIRAQIGH